MNVRLQLPGEQASRPKAAPRHVAVRKVRQSPVKLLLRWVYWLVLASVVLVLIFISADAALTMYKGLH